jgi:small subunit ribosomal protein S3
VIERIFIQKNYNKLKLENYLATKLERAGFTHLEMVKTPMVTRIVLHVARPGLAIGKGGETIKKLTEIMERDYKISNPQIEIQEIKNANINARVVADKIASSIEREYSWRSVVFKTMKEIIDSGVQGVELVVKGKLSGKGGRKRKQRIAFGYMKKNGAQTRLVDSANAASYPKAGAIGIRLSIIHPEVIFPDKIDILKVIKGLKATQKEAEEQAKKTAEAKEKIEITVEETVEETKKGKEEVVSKKVEKVELVDGKVETKEVKEIKEVKEVKETKVEAKKN